MSGVLLTGIGHLTTNAGSPINGAAVVVEDGRIAWVGREADAPEQGDRNHLDCSGRAVIPGFVDAHTHLVFAGDRSQEFSARMSGASYTEIAAAGGGILSTVRATRVASEEQLFASASSRVQRMIGGGTSSVEIKSGYGLDLESELKLLRVARRIGDELPVTVRTTFLGAHSVPPEFEQHREGYIQTIVGDMIPAVVGLADYCDVFVEEGVFSVDEARRVLLAGKEAGLAPRIHAEQLSRSGGAALAAEIGAVSADHLDHASLDDAEALAEAGVAAVLVPGASYSLRSQQAPGRMLWDAGCTVALATDCNPGTSYVESMSFVMGLAVVQMGLSLEEALWSATRGGALSLGLEDHGVIVPGAVGDLVVLDAPNPAHLAYRPGTNLVAVTIRRGSIVDHPSRFG